VRRSTEARKATSAGSTFSFIPMPLSSAYWLTTVGSLASSHRGLVAAGVSSKMCELVNMVVAPMSTT